MSKMITCSSREAGSRCFLSLEPARERRRARAPGYDVSVNASHVVRRAVVEVGDVLGQAPAFDVGWAGGTRRRAALQVGPVRGQTVTPEEAGTTWKPADARRRAKRDSLKHRHADRVLRAGSTRHRNARGGVRLGAQLAVALSLRLRAFCRVGPLEGKSSVWLRWTDIVRAETTGRRGVVWRRTAARGWMGHRAFLCPSVGDAEASWPWERNKVGHGEVALVSSSFAFQSFLSLLFHRQPCRAKQPSETNKTDSLFLLYEHFTIDQLAYQNRPFRVGTKIYALQTARESSVLSEESARMTREHWRTKLRQRQNRRRYHPVEWARASIRGGETASIAVAAPRGDAHI